MAAAGSFNYDSLCNYWGSFYPCDGRWHSSRHYMEDLQKNRIPYFYLCVVIVF